MTYCLIMPYLYIHPEISKVRAFSSIESYELRMGLEPSILLSGWDWILIGYIPQNKSTCTSKRHHVQRKFHLATINFPEDILDFQGIRQYLKLHHFLAVSQLFSMAWCVPNPLINKSHTLGVHSGKSWRLPSLKLTAFLPLKIGRNPKGK